MSAFTEAFQRGTEGMTTTSTGTCPGCSECMEIDGCGDAEEHRRKCSAVDCPSGEPTFSHCPCGICGTRLGGTRHAWHWIDRRQLDAARRSNEPRPQVNHEDDACEDCILYIANGTEPEVWRAR